MSGVKNDPVLALDQEISYQVAEDFASFCFGTGLP